MKSYCYLIHLDSACGRNFYGGASHYVGYSNNIQRRLANHAAGQGDGSKFTTEASRKGYDLKLGNLWYGNKDFEKKLHKMNGKYHCKLCKKVKGSFDKYEVSSILYTKMSKFFDANKPLNCSL